MSGLVNLQHVIELRRLVRDLEQAGWQARRNRAHEGVSDGPSIYLLDVETGRQFLLVTLADSIDNDSARLRESGFSHDNAVDGLAGIMEELITGKAAFDDEYRGALYLAAEAYVAGTRTYCTAREQQLLTDCAFVVLRYKDYATGYHLLRPVVIPNTRILTPEKVQLAAEQVLEIDRVAHPERFPRAKLLNFRVRPPECV